MKLSLNEIVENIAYALGQQFNMTLREALKHTVKIYREKLLREDDFNNGLNYNDFSQNIVMPLEDWNHPLCGRGKITVDELPKSVRFKARGFSNYYYVGDSTFGHAFTQTTLVSFPLINKIKYNIKPVYYIIENGKAIVLNNHKLCNLGLIGVFAEPQLVSKFCDNVEIVLDDHPYPISGDLLARIRTGIINGTFPVIYNEQSIITSNSNDENKQS